YQRGNFYHGFSSLGAFQSGFHVEANGAGQHPAYGVLIEDVCGTAPFLYLPNNAQTFLIAPDGSMEIGALGATSTPVMDMHCHATGKDYDVRFMASGGTANVGEGTLTPTAGVYLFKTSLSGVIGEGFRVATTGGATVNFLQAIGSITGQTPTLQSGGSDTN